MWTDVITRLIMKLKQKYIKKMGIKYIYKNIYVKHTIVPW